MVNIFEIGSLEVYNRGGGGGGPGSNLYCFLTCTVVSPLCYVMLVTASLRINLYQDINCGVLLLAIPGYAYSFASPNFPLRYMETEHMCYRGLWTVEFMKRVCSVYFFIIISSLSI